MTLGLIPQLSWCNPKAYYIDEYHRPNHGLEYTLGSRCEQNRRPYRKEPTVNTGFLVASLLQDVPRAVGNEEMRSQGLSAMANIMMNVL